jgi:flagellar biosynthesis anti-sigma factor FlgM
MRIDPSLQYLNQTAPEGVSNSKAAKPSLAETGGAPPAGGSADAGDTVQISATLSQVQQLTAQLSQSPDEGRAARVAALQQQVQQGSYRPSDEQIASAMITDLWGGGGKSS